MSLVDHIPAAIEYKYGLCADVAMHKDGTFEVTRWDESISGVEQPSNEQLLLDVQDYVSNVLPDKEADRDEDERLHKADIKFKKMVLSALQDINDAQPNLFSAETKTMYAELKALLR